MMAATREHPAPNRTAEAWFLAGTLAGNAGKSMHTLTAGLLLYEKTGTIAAFGIVLTAEQALTFLTQVIAGPWADKGDARRIAIMAETARGVLVTLFALMLLASPANALVWIMAMTAVIRVLHPFHRAGTFVLAPLLAPPGELTRLNSWYSAFQQGGQLLGLFACGLLIGGLGMPAVFLVNGVMLLLSAASLAMLPAQAKTSDVRETVHAPRPAWRNLVAPWAEIFSLLRVRLALLRLLVVSTADNVTLILFNLALTPLIAERLGGSPYWLSFAASAFAFGAMASSAAVTGLERRSGARKAILIGLGGQALAFALLAAAWHPAAMVAFAVMLGAFNTVSWTVALSAVQLEAPARVRGRIAMLRNGVTALIAAPLVPAMSVAADTGTVAAALLVAAGVCGLFLAVAGRAGDRRSLPN